MHHKAIIKAGNAQNLPINLQCSCGTGGDFGSAFDATNYISNHFRGLRGICTWKLQDTTQSMSPDVPVTDPQPAMTNAAEGDGG